MAEYEVYGNEYDKTLRILTDGELHVFDSLERAIQALAPRCENCGVLIIEKVPVHTRGINSQPVPNQINFEGIERPG